VKERYRTSIIVLIIIIAAVAAYVRGISAPFQFDDERDIVYRSEVARGVIAAAESSPYRALTYATYAIDWKLGKGRPNCFHVTNLFIHIAASLLLFFVISRVFKTSNLTEEIAAAVVSLGFAIHPLGVASASYISGRAGLLSGFFGLLLIWIWEGRKFRGRWGTLAVVEALALLAKEDAVVIPVLLAAVSIIERRKDFKELVPSFLISMIYGALRVFSHPVVVSEPGREISYASHLLMQPYVYCRAILMWLWPIGLSLDHHPAPISGLTDARIWLCGFAIIILFLLALLAIRKGQKTIGLSAAWFIFALAPGAIIPLADPVSENRWYFATAGLSILIAVAVNWVLDHKKTAGVALGILYLSCLFLSAYSRVEVSSDPSSLWAQSVELYPNAARPWSNFAMARQRDGAFQGAEFAARRAIAIEKNDAAAWNTLGLALKNTGKFDEALEAYRQAIFYDKNLFVAYTNQANILAATDKLAEAEYSYREALKISPDDLDANYGLAWVLAKTGHKNEAIRRLKNILDKTEDEQARQLLNKLINNQ